MITRTDRAIVHCIRLLELGTHRVATAYIAPNFTIRVVRQGRPRKGARTETFVVTYGKPNYAARQFIAACRRAGEPFPVKRPQLTREIRRKR